MTVVIAFITLATLILVHEFGHFLAAKLSGVYVEVFSIGFGPKIFKYQKGETLYCISAIPLGGYVKLHRMFKEEPEVDGMDSRSFYNKPFIKKIFIITAGVLFNLLSAVAIFILLFLFGFKTISPTVGYIQPNSPAAYAGLQNGDTILRVDGKKVYSWGDYEKLLSSSKVRTDVPITISRDNRDINLFITPNYKELKNALGDLESYADTGSSYYAEPYINSVVQGTPASDAGIAEGDKIISVDDIAVSQVGEVRQLIENGTGPVNLGVLTKDGVKSYEVYPSNVDGARRIGVSFSLPYVTVHYNMFDAVAAGLKETVDLTRLIYVGIWYTISGKISRKDAVAGPITIVQATSNSLKSGLDNYFIFVAAISINLAVLNLLPIPVLDGGYAVMYIYEAVTKRVVSIKVREVSQRIGFMLLMLLMVFAFYTDIAKLLK